jgi:hypothetical protein
LTVPNWDCGFCIQKLLLVCRKLKKEINRDAQHRRKSVVDSVIDGSKLGLWLLYSKIVAGLPQTQKGDQLRRTAPTKVSG